MEGSVERVRARRAAALGALVAVAVLWATPAAVADAPSPSPGAAAGSAGNQVVLVGRVVVPRGLSVREVVVFSGRVSVAGVVRGDVVVLNGPIFISGQVSGSVIALSGSVRLLSGAQVAGDVLAHDRAIIAEDAFVEGRVREDMSFTLSGPLRAIAAFVSWLAVAVSTLLLGVLLAGIAPRALDGSARAARTAPFASAGWGLGLSILVPVLATGSIALVVGLPFGLAVILSLLLAALLGVVVAAHTLGRIVVGDGRATAVAFLAGWAIAAAVGLVPFVSGVVFVLSAVFGIGALAVAIWRARGVTRGGRHRRGAASVPLLGDASGAGVDPRPTE